jgi:phospholipid N-methyltransferase
LVGEAAEVREPGPAYTATYSPDDNKLRLYSVGRLDAETYERVRAAGFIFAPKQDLFVAPKWTPERADLLVELCGEIGDEDTSLVDRAEQRAERFGGYSERRGEEAERAREAVAAITDNIPMGQPILVGHHSERRARKDAERIENGMRKALKLWDTSTYWTRRAAGALAHAKYKERPDVRARRIKTIEADMRRAQRAGARAEAFARHWEYLQDGTTLVRRDGAPSTSLDRALHLANLGAGCRFGMWSDLRDGKITPEDAQREALATCSQLAARSRREVTHCENRLVYERAMLAESGYMPPPKPRTKAALPLLNYSGSVSYLNPYRRGEVVTAEAVGITKAELAAIHTDYKGTRVSADGTHRVRTAMLKRPGAVGGSLCIVFLTDSKQHARPAAPASGGDDAGEGPRPAPRAAAEKPADERGEAFAALRAQLRQGVRAVSAPQLFPTPSRVAEEMVRRADLEPGHKVLEPSAGTGPLLRAIAAAGVDPADVTAVEINRRLAEALPATLAGRVFAEDFLTVDLGGPFDRIVMNPPFERAADIQHVRRAFEQLAPGGRLVAIVADGPRQREHLRPWVIEQGGAWEEQAPDTFAEQGTNVRVVMLVVEARS